jgi:hypothetical protein
MNLISASSLKIHTNRTAPENRKENKEEKYYIDQLTEKKQGSHVYTGEIIEENVIISCSIH